MPVDVSDRTTSRAEPRSAVFNHPQQILTLQATRPSTVPEVVAPQEVAAAPVMVSPGFTG